MRHAIVFVYGVGHISEDGDEAFIELLSVFEKETWWDFGNLLEIQFDELCTSFTFIVVCRHCLDLEYLSERAWCGLVRPRVGLIVVVYQDNYLVWIKPGFWITVQDWSLDSVLVYGLFSRGRSGLLSGFGIGIWIGLMGTVVVGL